MNSEESDLIIGHLQKHDGGSNAKSVNHLIELLARGQLGCVTHTFHLDLRPECQTANVVSWGSTNRPCRSFPGSGYGIEASARQVSPLRSLRPSESRPELGRCVVSKGDAKT